MEILDNLFIFILFLTMIFVFGYLNNKYHSKKTTGMALNNDFVYKVLNKKCSVKRIHKAQAGKKAAYYNKCNVYMGSDFIIIQSIKDLIFPSVTTTFALLKPGTCSLKNWSGKIFALLDVELLSNRGQVKIVYQTDYRDESAYSLIINNLTPQDINNLSVIMEWH